MTTPADPAQRHPRPGRVLVVDDKEANRFLLRELLEPEGHEVIEAADGAEALELARTTHPDVVLLDVQMPGMDGFEVCRRLKADEATSAIPVLLVTALNARDDRLTGISEGADEFLTKPIDRIELALRVRNAITAHSLLVASRQQYRALRELEAMRDTLVHLMVHDLRSPLTGVLSNLELIRMDAANLGAETLESVTDALASTRRMADMVGDLLDVSRMEEHKLPLSLERLDLNSAIEEATRIFAYRHAIVEIVHGPEPVQVHADRSLVLRVITNLVDNAVNFSPPGAAVTVKASVTPRGATVTVTDTGVGIAREAQPLIFDKFGQVGGVKHPRRSSGLGLAFCKLAVDAHGGQIGVESDGTSGSEFWFALPVAKPAG